MGAKQGGYMIYTIQVKQGIYLTDRLNRTKDLQSCILINDYKTAELYLQDRRDRVIKLKIRNNIIIIEESL